jgi:hypothetical protein
MNPVAPVTKYLMPPDASPDAGRGQPGAGSRAGAAGQLAARRRGGHHGVVERTATSAPAPTVDATDAALGPAGASEPCARCGRDADADFGSVWLCLDCYHVAGSTCAGIGVGSAPTDPVC